ncbi:uncharacterized protein C8R40DRAFT_1054738, partial [Lentinula edodes]|uniref:uncharacterized protein n=1 Tax=Lentinula edodes TaxID=5353 RepID=UPI001E8CF8E5
MRKNLKNKNKHLQPHTSNLNEPFHKKPLTNRVKIINKSYLEKTFTGSDSHQNMLTICTDQYSLNEEQERAFKIVANHASSPLHEQLKMYIGGMGGTGKSQVLKAL